MVRLAGCKWIPEVKVSHSTCSVTWGGKSEVSAYWLRNGSVKKTMFYLRLLINLSSFRTNSLRSKATLSKFGMLNVCSPLISSYAEVRCLCFCLAGHLWLSQALPLHLLCFLEHFCLLHPTEKPWSSSEQSPEAPCSFLLITQHGPHLAGGAGLTQGFPASQELC